MLQEQETQELIGKVEKPIKIHPMIIKYDIHNKMRIRMILNKVSYKQNKN